ncbi:hypothetical protein ACIQWN_28820 [Streptomyces vinaceus]|uniref:hypothetical protein n=1 Tax=Streptomyces vinaceus TaxID=1960 RepID=UPI00380C5C17
MTEIRTMALAKLLTEFTNGDQTSWDEERAWLLRHHPRRMARIEAEIADGNFPPIRLDFAEQCVIDGHHRIIAAERLGRQTVPVANAWDGSEWWFLASDQGGDDPEPAP